MRFFFASLAVPLLAVSLGCRQSSGPATEDRSPVRGTVKVAGRPATGLIVRFHLEPGTADPRALTLVEARTEADGSFKVSQTLPDDGLAPGKYSVTFFWPPGGDSDAPVSVDQLSGRYLKPEKSQFRVTIQANSNELPPFELK